MFQQILIHTPAWVWAILAFLVYRGLLASSARESSLRIVVAIPVAMLALSLQGMLGGFDASPAALLLWLACVLAGGAAAWRSMPADGIRADPERKRVWQRGSWMPLALMLGIFLTKYAVGVTLALRPALAHDAGFVLATSSLYGAFNGIFLGRMLRVLAVWREAAITSPGAAAPAPRA